MFISDYIWKFAIKDQKTQKYYPHPLSQDDENRFLNSLCNIGNPKCLQRFLSASRKPAVANINVQHAKFTNTHLKLSAVIETKFIELLELLGEVDVVTCIYLCLKNNNCEDLVLCFEDG